MGENSGIMLRIVPVRVLIIDDDPSACRRLGAWLREAAYDVVSFCDPAEGLAHAGQAPCQVGLVDLRLSRMDGAVVLGQLHRLAADMRLIAMSAFPEVPQVIAAIRAGARDLLEKPVQREPLLEAVGRQLAELGVGVRSEQEFNRRLGARIRLLRTQARRTLADVASECDITMVHLSQVELGKKAPSVWVLARIAGALKTPLGRLLDQI